jgi:hypothetical protein
MLRQGRGDGEAAQEQHDDLVGAVEGQGRGCERGQGRLLQWPNWMLDPLCCVCMGVFARAEWMSVDRKQEIALFFPAAAAEWRLRCRCCTEGGGAPRAHLAKHDVEHCGGGLLRGQALGRTDSPVCVRG